MVIIEDSTKLSVKWKISARKKSDWITAVDVSKYLNRVKLPISSHIKYKYHDLNPPKDHEHTWTFFINMFIWTCEPLKMILKAIFWAQRKTMYVWFLENHNLNLIYLFHKKKDYVLLIGNNFDRLIYWLIYVYRVDI